MRTKALLSIASVALAAALYSQTIPLPGTQPPANGPAYWANPAPDCSSLAGESPVAILNASGAVAGYSCYVSGTFVWLAAGGGWTTAIRVAAPESAAIGVDYSFYDTAGDNLKLDGTAADSPVSGDDVSFALAADQPAEIGLLGATSGAPRYANTATGTVYAVFYCPDAATCAEITPQLLYSALPATSWTLSVPIAWDTALNTAWSAVGVDDGGARRVSLVVYNEDIAPASYPIRVFDRAGNLAASGATPPIPPLQSLPSGAYGEGGAYGAMLSDVVTGSLPSGPFKILIGDGSSYSAVEVLQVNGPSATALQVGYDNPAGAASTDTVQLLNQRRSRAAFRPKTVFAPLPDHARP